MLDSQEILDRLPVQVWQSDATGQRIYFGKAITALSGTEMSNQWLDLVHDSDKEAVLKAYETAYADFLPFEIEYRIRLSNGKYNWFLDNGIPHRDENGSITFIGSSTNIDKQMKASICDSMTGLYNKGFFMEYLKKITSRGSKKGIAIIIADANGLKNINDNFGHPSGDMLIIEVANILNNSFRKEDVVSRTGGDEFAIMVSGIDSYDMEVFLEKKCQDIGDDIEEYNKKAKNPWRMSVAIGHATYYGQEIEQLIREADNAMYSNKKLVKSEVI